MRPAEEPEFSDTLIDPELLRVVRQFVPLAAASMQCHVPISKLKRLAQRTLYDEEFFRLGLFRKISTTWLVDTEAFEAWWHAAPSVLPRMSLWRVWAPFLWGQALLLLLVGAAAVIAWSLGLFA